MKIEIEKLTNGYVVSIDGKRTFCDVPEAICGLTSEAVLAECTRLERKPSKAAAMKAALAQARQYRQQREDIARLMRPTEVMLTA